MNRVMIEQTNSAVSPIFDAADDCNMGQFLQLGLPSGCISEPPEQITAEPSLEDKDSAIAFPDSQPFRPTSRQSDATMAYIEHENSVVCPIFADATDCNMGQILHLGLQYPIHNNESHRIEHVLGCIQCVPVGVWKG